MSRGRPSELRSWTVAVDDWGKSQVADGSPILNSRGPEVESNCDVWTNLTRTVDARGPAVTEALTRASVGQARIVYPAQSQTEK